MIFSSGNFESKTRAGAVIVDREVLTGIREFLGVVVA